MSAAKFFLSAFGDEIAEDLQEQVQLLNELEIGHLELRGVWGKNVLELDHGELAAIRQTCVKQNTAIGCIGSPVGKSPIAEPIEWELSRLARVFQIAEALGPVLRPTSDGVRQVRVFSFYPPDTHTNVHYDRYVEEAADRLSKLTEMAKRGGFCLLLENEREIIGDTPERCQAILSSVGSSSLRFVWDPANFVQAGIAQPTDRGWPILAPYVTRVHIKDAVMVDGSVRVAGEGDGQVAELLSALRDRDYQGFLALEPHLAIAGQFGGFSGTDGMRRAVSSLRQLLTTLGCAERRM